MMAIPMGSLSIAVLIIALYHVPGCDFGSVFLCLVFHILMMLLVDTLEMLRFSDFLSSSFSLPTLSLALYGALTGLCRPVGDERFSFTLGC